MAHRVPSDRIRSWAVGARDRTGRLADGTEGSAPEA